MTARRSLPPASPVWIAYCKTCGVMFSHTTSYMRELVVDDAQKCVCVRCLDSRIGVGKFKFAPRVTGRKA